MRRILVAILIAVFVPAFALAQTPRPRPTEAIKLPDPLHLITPGDSTGTGSSGANNIGQLLLKPFQDLANFIGDDIDAAITLSTSIPELQDGHGQQCLMALKTFGTIFKAHPAPLTLHIATDLEALRLFQISANNLCGNPHCTQVFADLATTIQTAAPANFSIPIPSLHDVCSKVPQIAVVPGVQVTPTPVTTTPATTTPAHP